MNDESYKPGDLVKLKAPSYVTSTFGFCALWLRTSCGWANIRNGSIGMVISKHPKWEQYRVLVNDEIILINTGYIVLYQKT